MFKEQKDQIKDLTDELKKEQEELKSHKEDLDLYKNKYEKITIDFIGILGIFSALIFGLFGGFDTLTSSMRMFAESSTIAESVFYTSLVAACLIVFIYSLLYWVGKLAGTKINSGSFKSNGDRETFFDKHSSFFTILEIIVVVILISILAMIVDKLFPISDKSLWIQLIIVVVVLFIVLIHLINNIFGRGSSIRSLLKNIHKKISKR